jgi:hypothetical protein
MGKKIAITVLAIGLLVALVSILGGSTGARLSDTESSSPNVIGAYWEQADCLIVDTSDICLNPAGKWICCVWVMNDCQFDIAIDKVMLSWTPDGGEILDKMQFRHYDTLEWKGSAPSGTLIDIEDCPLPPAERVCICLFFGDSAMHGKSFTIEFTMFDGTLVTATFETPEMMALEGEALEGETLEEPAPEEECNCPIVVEP